MQSDIIEILKKNVNLLGYGISENWLGYTERNGPFQKEIARKIIDVFLSRFPSEEIQIVTSLVKIKGEIIDDNIDLSNYLERIEEGLIGQDFILISDEETEYVDDYPTSIMNPTFRGIDNCSSQLIFEFSMLSFVDSSVHGHCFFVLKEKGVIAYPHEDTGFGFISFNDSQHKSSVNDFFQKLRRMKVTKSLLKLARLRSVNLFNTLKRSERLRLGAKND